MADQHFGHVNNSTDIHLGASDSSSLPLLYFTTNDKAEIWSVQEQAMQSLWLIRLKVGYSQKCTEVHM